jgi:hypothetical protein
VLNLFPVRDQDDALGVFVSGPAMRGVSR